MAPKKNSKTESKVIRKRIKVKEAHVNFEEIDEVRSTVRAKRKEYLKRSKAGKKVRHLHSFSYQAAYFSVGRNATYVRFTRVNLPEPSVARLAKELALMWPQYGIYYSHRDMYVYLRGEPWWERKKA